MIVFENLRPCTADQARYEIHVAFQKIVVAQPRPRRPNDVPKDPVDGLAAIGPHVDEADGNAPTVRIRMRRAGQDGARCRFDAEFFAEFAPQAGGLVFAVFDFAAGELPLQGVKPVAAALADEHLGRTGQQSRGHAHDR